MKRLPLFLSAAFLVLLLAACTEQSPATDSEDTAQGATVTEDSSTKTGGPSDPVLTLGEDGQGTVSTQWTVGDNTVQVTQAFTYTTQDNGEKVITDIGAATVENLKGWFSVDPEVEIQADKIFRSEDGWIATVPFLYYASDGSGQHTYDGVSIIELNTWSTTPEEDA